MPTRLVTRVTAVAFATLLAACTPEQAPPTPTTSTGPSVNTAPTVPSDNRAPGAHEFTDRIDELPASGNCALDVLNGQPFAEAATVDRSNDATAGGWVANAEGRVPADALFVMTGPTRSYAFPIAVGVPREDVARALNNEALKFAGYGVTLPLSEVEVGTYNLAIVMGGADRHVCAYGNTLSVTD